MRGNSRLPSGTCTKPNSTRRRGRTVSIRAPSNHTSPPASGTKPEIARRHDVLPAPLAPISVTDSPPSTVSDTLSSTRAVPYATAILRTSSSIVLEHPEIGLDHPWISGNLDRRALCYDSAELQHGDAVAYPHHRLHVVLHQHDRDSLRVTQA